MPRKVIHLDMTLAELSGQIDAAVDGESCDEYNRDWDLNPVSDEDVLERVRQIERETGQTLIFWRGELPERRPHT